MKTPCTLLRVAMLPVAAALPMLAQSTVQPDLHLDLSAAAGVSSSTAETPVESALFAAPHTQTAPVAYRPFKDYAIGLRLGTGGIGGEIATPLGTHFVLRGGVQAFSYTTSFTTNGLNADGTLKLGDSFASLDYHPFHNGFHLSPGYTLHNGANVTANILVLAGQSFTLDNTDYTSSPTDPIKGNAALTFGNKTAPRFTMGYANLFSKSGGHFSLPIEIGFEYISYPKVALTLSGTGCSAQGCGPINDPANQANIDGEIVKLNNDLAPARFFPIFSIGLDYRFGH